MVLPFVAKKRKTHNVTISSENQSQCLKSVLLKSSSCVCIFEIFSIWLLAYHIDFDFFFLSIALERTELILPKDLWESERQANLVCQIKNSAFDKVPVNDAEASVSSS